jgi:hypothetical protein
MPKYALYDPTLTPSPVCGWLDTDAIDYPNLPPAEKLFQMTEEQWKNRMEGHYAIQGGDLVGGQQPVQVMLTPHHEMRVKVLAGIQIASEKYPELNDTWPLDKGSIEKLRVAAVEASSGLGWALGQTTFPYANSAGKICQLTEDQVVALYKATRDRHHELQTAADQAKATGAKAVFPEASATLTIP